MADIVDRAARSRMMGAIKGKNTSPERLIRKSLHKKGFRFSLHSPKLPSKPDLLLPKWNAVVLVHGCYWHRHRGCLNATTPSTRTAFWLEKFRKNVERDQRNRTKLLDSGWRVFVVWECGVRYQLDDVVERLAALIKTPEVHYYELPEAPPKRMEGGEVRRRTINKM